jgi:hypothetical protein
MRNFDDEIKKLEAQIEQVKQDKKDSRILASQNILDKLQTGKYEVYFKDEFNDGWFDVVGFGAISGMDRRNILSLSSIDDFEKIVSGTNTDPDFVQIGPVDVGIYKETRTQYDAVHMYNSYGRNVGRGSELVGIRKENIAVTISPELQIRLKNQSSFDLGDLDFDDLGF